MSSTSIADYGLLSDRHSAALVNRDGSVDWLCFPRFDGPSVFGRLLDDDGGHWSIRPVQPYRVSRRYRDRTMVLETTFRTSGGTLRVTDALILGRDDGGHRIGVGVPRMLVREVTCTDGELDVAVDYRPRPEYGLIRPLLSCLDGAVTARGGAEWLVLTSPVALTPGPDGAAGRTRLAAGRTLRFALQRSTLDEEPAHAWEQEELATWLTMTETAWRSWSALHQAYEGPWRDLVQHSGRVLEALSYQPRGAKASAGSGTGTTGMPGCATGA
jgi:alpha,alpha-trehalase